jgi:soluble lytic murein transglycosylase
MKRLLLAFLLCTGLEALTLEQISTKPPSRAKNFLIWQYFQEDISPEQADDAFYQLQNVNRKLFLAYAQKSGRPEVKYTAKCMQLAAEELAEMKDGSCAKIALSPYKASSLTPVQRNRIASYIDDNATTAWLAMMNDLETKEGFNVSDYSPEDFITLFNGTSAEFQSRYLDSTLNEAYMEELSTTPGFHRAVVLMVTDKNLRNLQYSLLGLHGENLGSEVNFFLALNQLRHGRSEAALTHLHIAYNKAYYRLDKDKVRFWQYLITKDETLLRELSESVDINIYSLYAKEKFRVEPENYYTTLVTKHSRKTYDLRNPFVWKFILDEIKATPKEKLYDLAKRYESERLLPVHSFIIERASGYRLHGFIMPYEEELKGLDRDDKALFYALMRQESHFIPSSISSSYALGLMQLMPFLVESLDKRVKEKRTSLAQMFEPSRNLKYAKKHLQYLQKYLFHPLFIAYAYNGGIGFTKRYLLKNNFAAGFFEPYMSIEMMANSQSREYGKKVLANYVIYKDILGEKVSITHLFETLTQPARTDRFRVSE